MAAAATAIALSCFNGAAIRRRRRDAVRDHGRAAGRVASTEPPSEDGGEGAVTTPASVHVAALQRSRHPKTAERRSSRALVAASAECFNGAAIRRRRRAQRKSATSSFVRRLQRSRHPKTAESGTSRACTSLARRRFNGAAIRRRRRGVQGAAALRRRAAASTEPPSEDGGERTTPRASPRASPRLQRSRHPKTAERDFVAPNHRLRRLLQRSRHPKTAERRRRPCRASWRRSRFNGAAIRRRRRGGMGRGRSWCSRGLQRSRHPKTAESRSASRGESVSALLQRSRHPKTAERWVRAPLERCREPASTEPPSEDGGEERRRVRVRVRVRASTEPPSEDGGELACPGG